MQLHRNEALLKSRLKMSVVYFVASLTCLLGGFLASGRFNDLGMQYAVSLSTLGFGIGLWWKNKVYLARWGPRSQQDRAIAHELRGLDSRYHLFAFASGDLPDYLLVGPMGVVVLVPRAITGTVVCSEGRWTHDEGKPALVRLSLLLSPRPSLGNPTGEASGGVAAVKRFLGSRLEEDEIERVPIEAAVVLMEPNVKLTAQGCTTPVLLLKNLRSHVRRANRALDRDDLDAVVDVVGGNSG